MNKNWVAVIITFAFISFATIFYIGGRLDGKRSISPCGIGDSYGFHKPDDPQIVTCSDKRQELIIERKGTLLGFYEYRCHCQ